MSKANTKSRSAGVVYTISPEQAIKKYDLSKHKNRPTVKEYISLIFDEFIELHGDRGCGDDKAVICGIATLGGTPVSVIGHVKGKNTAENIAANFGMPHPEGYRKALRQMKNAEKFGRPIITFVDTPGAYCGVSAEERGQGEAIARNLLEMSRLRVPVISVITGEGGSGGALGICLANRVFMLENAVFSVISAKGCASILWKDPKREREAAVKLRMTADDLLALGIIEDMIPEPGDGAHSNASVTAAAIKAALLKNLEELRSKTPEELVNERYEKYRAIGFYGE